MQERLSDILSQGEGQTTEFKKSLGLRREGLEALCAMVNSDAAHGTVLFGVAPDGTVCGVEAGNLDKAQRTLSQAMNDRFEPRITPEIWVETSGGKSVILVAATRLSSVPYHEYAGRAWIRQGSAKRLLGLQEKADLRRSRDRAHQTGPWRCDRCGSIVGLLVSMKITDKGMEKSYDCSCGGQFWPAT